MRQVVGKNWSYQLLIQLLFSSQHPYLMCIGQWKQTTYVSFEILKTFKDVSILLFRGPLMEVQLPTKKKTWNIWNPQSHGAGWFRWCSSSSFLVGDFQGLQQPSICLGGSEMMFPHKNQPKRTYPPKDLANSRPTIVRPEPIVINGMIWDPYKWPKIHGFFTGNETTGGIISINDLINGGPLGVITTLTPQVPMKNEGFYTLKLWVITPKKWRFYVGFLW